MICMCPLLTYNTSRFLFSYYWVFLFYAHLYIFYILSQSFIPWHPKISIKIYGYFRGFHLQKSVFFVEISNYLALMCILWVKKNFSSVSMNIGKQTIFSKNPLNKDLICFVLVHMMDLPLHLGLLTIDMVWRLLWRTQFWDTKRWNDIR